MGRLLGSDTVQAVADDRGRSPDEAKSGLAKAVPRLVNVLTPGGKLPPDGDLTRLGSRQARSVRDQAGIEAGLHELE
jgi:uncharacterized protein YidB (DUF937 family)